MADDSGVVGQTDVFGVVVVVVAARSEGLLVADESALDVDAHRPRAQNRLLDVRLHRRASRAGVVTGV